jgi:hypothetical protein
MVGNSNLSQVNDTVILGNSCYGNHFNAIVLGNNVTTQDEALHLSSLATVNSAQSGSVIVPLACAAFLPIYVGATRYLLPLYNPAP